MNGVDLIEIERAITAKRVDAFDAVCLLETIYRQLEREYGELPESVFETFELFSTAVETLEDATDE